MLISPLIRSRYLGLALAVFFCYSCDNTSTSESGETDTLAITDLFSDFEKNAGEEQTASSRGSQDYTGTYVGVLPCADCAGIKTEILITDSSYIKRTIYLGEGRPDPYEARGGASWDSDRRILTLGGITPPNRYLVERNTITQLDRQGRKITGRLASRYVLQKE